MRAQFEDKKLPTTDFKIAVNGRVLDSVSEPSKRAAIFKVKNEQEVFDIFKRMTGAANMPKPIIRPKGVIYPYTMADGTKVGLRNLSKSDTGVQWTLDFAKKPEMNVTKLEIKLIHD